MIKSRPPTRAIDVLRKLRTRALVVVSWGCKTTCWLIVVLFAAVTPLVIALIPMLTSANLARFTAHNYMSLGISVLSLASLSIIWWVADLFSKACNQVIRERHIS